MDIDGSVISLDFYYRREEMKCDVCGSKEVTATGRYTTCISHSHMIDEYKESRDKAWKLYRELKKLFYKKGMP
jgi:hypothetical protein